MKEYSGLYPVLFRSIDNRMVSASLYGQPSVEYTYDISGRRVLRNSTNEGRERYYFSGLHEEITKRAVGTTSNNTTAFAYDERCGNANLWSWPVSGTTTNVNDAQLSRTVTQFSFPTWGGANFWSGTQSGLNERTASFWVKNTDVANNPLLVGFFVNTSAGNRYSVYNRNRWPIPIR